MSSGALRRAVSRICAPLWRWGWLVWAALGAQIAGNLASSILVSPPEWLRQVRDSPLGWLFTHPSTAVLSLLMLLLLSVAIYLGSHPNVVLRIPDTERAYLARVVKEHQQDSLTGIPDDLIADSVNLDEIFVEPTFVRRAVAEFPLTEAERRDFARLLDASGTSEVERILADAEQIRPSFSDDRFTLADVLGHLDAEKPVLVVQGKPGAGKSTLLARLALNLARHARGDDDPLPALIEPIAIPIFVPLRIFADVRANNAAATVSLWDFIGQLVSHWEIAGVVEFLEVALRRGECLVLLDGLDEVSDVSARKAVQQAITEFVRNFSSPGTGRDRRYNRFIITSRLAGYDQQAFPDAAAHVTIAEFTVGQIDLFVTQWSRAASRLDSRPPVSGLAEVNPEARELRNLIDSRPELRELAGTPLMLALFTLLHRNHVALSLRRSEIFATIVRTMLESRNVRSQQPTVPEDEAIAKLGPVAMHMQSAGGNNMAARPTVMNILSLATAAYHAGADASIAQAERFLHLVRVRGGVFGRRTSEYYGFAHRSFQEYFAARHLLREVTTDPETEIPRLIGLARDPSGIWRDPFVLVVAYASDTYAGDTEDLAGRILHELLGERPADDDVILCAESLVDVKPATVARALQRRIATELIGVYETASLAHDWASCRRIEDTAQALLVRAAGRRAPHLPPFTEVLAESMAAEGPGRRTAAALLAMVAGEVAHLSVDGALPLVPAVMGLAGAPAAGDLQPVPVGGEVTPEVQGYCVTILSMLGPGGPAGYALQTIQQQIEDQPAMMEMAARLSLRTRTLLTPTVAPVSRDMDERYRLAVEAWQRQLAGQQPINRHARSIAFTIQSQLLRAADQVRYPLAGMIVAMLGRAVACGAGEEVRAARAYLAEVMRTEDFLGYRLAAMTWTAVFTDIESQEELASLLRDQFIRGADNRQQFARCYLAMLCDDKRTAAYRRYLDRIRTGTGSSAAVAHDVRDLHRLKDMQALRGLNYGRFTRSLTYLGYLRSVRGLHYMSGARIQRPLVIDGGVGRKALDDLRECVLDPGQTWAAMDLIGILREWTNYPPVTDGEEDGPRPAMVGQAAGEALVSLGWGELAESLLSLIEDCLDAEPTLAPFPDRLANRATDPRIATELLRLADRPDDGLHRN